MTKQRPLTNEQWNEQTSAPCTQSRALTEDNAQEREQQTGQGSMEPSHGSSLQPLHEPLLAHYTQAYNQVVQGAALLLPTTEQWRARRALGHIIGTTLLFLISLPSLVADERILAVDADILDVLLWTATDALSDAHLLDSARLVRDAFLSTLRMQVRQQPMLTYATKEYLREATRHLHHHAANLQQPTDQYVP